MFALDLIPVAVLDLLREKGIPQEELLIGAYCDRNRDLMAQDTYVFVTQREIFILSGILSAKTAERNRKTKAPKPDHTFTLLAEERYALHTLHRFHVEELLSAGRLVAKRTSEKSDGSAMSNPAVCADRSVKNDFKTGDPSFEEEETVLLTCFTNFCKDSMLLLAKYAEKLAQGEPLAIDEKDDPANKRCPKCGMRYPDSNRPVCPRCMEKGKLFLRFSAFFLRYRAYLIALVLSLALLTVAGIAVPYLSSGFFYDEVIYGTGSFAGELLLAILLIAGAKLLKLLATVINNSVAAVVAPKVIFDLKKTIFSSIKRLSLRFFTSRQTGGLITQVNEDANTIYSFFCDGLPYMLVNAVQVLVLVVLMFLISPVLAVLVLLTVPAFLLLIRWMYQRERHLHSKRFAGSKQLNSFLSDVFSGMRVVKAFSKESEEIDRFHQKNHVMGDSEKALALFTNYAWPMANMVLYLGNLIAWGVGGWMVIRGDTGLTYGLLLTFIAYMNMVFEPLDFFVDFIDWSADCSNAIQRLFEIMDAQPDVSEKENAISPPSLNGTVEFSHVSFSYQKGKKIIEDVSFQVPSGHILGIVGHTGAGKSTLANLLMRLYDTDEGEISVGGYPIRDLSFDALHRNIAIVSQETYLFLGTLLENIRYARPDATFEEVVEAAKLAGAHDFIMRFPDAYHTRVGFGYQELSGGERQRISIARAILKDPQILILDEATAAMDTETERRIQDALSRLIRGKTAIMIAHRLSTLRDADRLIVIEHGRVAEEGTHDELLQKEDGIYKKLYTLQEEALKSAGIRD